MSATTDLIVCFWPVQEGLVPASSASMWARAPRQGPGCFCFSVVTAAAKRLASSADALRRLPR
ncbi:MAG: hypothetical protein E3J21_07545 [Anaerolineales bacterium]|nr:MAG: hypothetical protein E3J21_07545 [Anaerolineales bacterium]